MLLLMVIGALMGIHLALVVIAGVKLTTVLYWAIPIVPAFLMACAHPQPHRRHPRRLR
jgi:hypothetical protein